MIGGTYRQSQLYPNFIQPLHLSLHLLLTLLPESLLFRLFKPDRGSLLEWRHTREANPGMCGAGIFDQMGFSDQPTHAPTSAVKVLSCRADRDGKVFNFGGEGRDASERGVVETVVDFVGEDYDVVFYAEFADCEEFLASEDFADGVVRGVDDDHLRLLGKRRRELVDIKRPLIR